MAYAVWCILWEPRFQSILNERLIASQQTISILFPCYIMYNSVWRTNFTIIRRDTKWSSPASGRARGHAGLWTLRLSGDAQTRGRHLISDVTHHTGCHWMSLDVTSLCSALRGPADTERVTRSVLCARPVRVLRTSPVTPGTGISWAQGPHWAAARSEKTKYTSLGIWAAFHSVLLFSCYKFMPRIWSSSWTE